MTVGTGSDPHVNGGTSIQSQTAVQENCKGRAVSRDEAIIPA